MLKAIGLLSSFLASLAVGALLGFLSIFNQLGAVVVGLVALLYALVFTLIADRQGSIGVVLFQLVVGILGLIFVKPL